MVKGLSGCTLPKTAKLYFVGGLRGLPWRSSAVNAPLQRNRPKLDEGIRVSSRLPGDPGPSWPDRIRALRPDSQIRLSADGMCRDCDLAADELDALLAAGRWPPTAHRGAPLRRRAGSRRFVHPHVAPRIGELRAPGLACRPVKDREISDRSDVLRPSLP
jgi:hypothetical protein